MQTFATQLTTAFAGLGFYEAAQWINTGHGLNPFLALPLATVLIFAPYVLNNVMQNRKPNRRSRN